MDAKTKRELNALLAFIGNKKLELSQSLPFLYFPIGDKAWSREYQPSIDNNGSEGVDNSIKREEIIPYTNGLVLDHNDGSYKYLDITDYWERLSQRFDTLSLYIAKAMGLHWFLLYYVHRSCLSWRGRSIVVEKPAVASIKRIDAILSSISYTHGEVGRDQVQDIVDFAAKVVGNLDITKITELYFENADAFDADNRLAKLESFIKALPPDDSIELCEVLDSISFVLKYGGYWGARELYRIYFYSAPPSYKCLCLNNEHFPDYYKAISEELPNVILPFFNNVEELLDGIRKEYGDQKPNFDRDVQTIVDELLAQSQLEITEGCGNDDENKILHSSVKKTNVGARPKKWLKVAMDEDDIQKLLKEQVWTGIMEDVERLEYAGMSEFQKDKAMKACGAAIISYAATQVGLTYKNKFNLPAERVFRFLKAPRTSVNDYLDKLQRWYVLLSEAKLTRKSNIDINTLKEWKAEDPTRAAFIINNYHALKRIINNATYLLGVAFRVKTDVEFNCEPIGSDPILGGSMTYDDNIGTENFGRPNNYHPKQDY